MYESAIDGGGILATRVSSCLVLAVGKDLAGSALERLRTLAIEELQGLAANAVVFDLGALCYLDGQEFAELRSIARMVDMLGAPSIFVGLQPGVIVHLMRLEADTAGLRTALGLDEALQQFGIIGSDGHAWRAP